MITKLDPALNTLAEQYAALKVEADKIKAQMEVIKANILLSMHPGEAVTTQEYRLTCNPGRSSVEWICSKEDKKQFQDELIKRGLMDIKVGDPYIVVRFLKQGDHE